MGKNLANVSSLYPMGASSGKTNRSTESVAATASICRCTRIKASRGLSFGGRNASCKAQTEIAAVRAVGGRMDEAIAAAESRRGTATVGDGNVPPGRSGTEGNCEDDGTLGRCSGGDREFGDMGAPEAALLKAARCCKTSTASTSEEKRIFFEAGSK